jgi:hypothetical protein
MKTRGHDMTVGFYPIAKLPHHRNVNADSGFSRRPTATKNETQKAKGLLC